MKKVLLIAVALMSFYSPVYGAEPNESSTATTTKAKKTAPSVVDAVIAPAASGEASSDDILSALDYPELNVVPRASERLNMESQLEGDKGWLAFWPFHLSALTTVLTGYSLSGDYKEDMDSDERKDADLLTKTATGVGVGWIALSTYYVLTKPYGNESRKVRSIQGKDKRSDLLRERLAEEALERPARLVRIFTWMSAITNFAANAILLDQSTPDNNIYPVIGMLASTLPFVFNNRYVDNYEKHLEYKRKIYAPVAGLGWRPSQQAGKFDPMLNLAWSF